MSLTSEQKQDLQNAYDVMDLTTEHVLNPLMTIKHQYLQELQGGGPRTRSSGGVSGHGLGEGNTPSERSIRERRRMTRIAKLVKQIKKLYTELNKLLKTPFDTKSARDRAMKMVKHLSSKLFNVVEVFNRNLDKIAEMPKAVVQAMGNWWPFKTSSGRQSPSRRQSPRVRRRSPERLTYDSLHNQTTVH